ncbi:hypothetical protein BHUM_04278, partial [Candidatus Burkholderia humilis]
MHAALPQGILYSIIET